MKAWLRRKMQGTDRRHGPWIMWLGWRYRGRLRYSNHNGYHSLSFAILFVDWVAADR